MPSRIHVAGAMITNNLLFLRQVLDVIVEHTVKNLRVLMVPPLAHEVHIVIESRDFEMNKHVLVSGGTRESSETHNLSHRNDHLLWVAHEVGDSECQGVGESEGIDNVAGNGSNISEGGIKRNNHIRTSYLRNYQLEIRFADSCTSHRPVH